MKQHKTQLRFLKLSVVVAFAAALMVALLTGPARSEASQHKEAERFDYLVRADFFAGMTGDREALARVIKLCEQRLAQNPKHAEAMVWHGAAMIALSGEAFQKQDFKKGMELWSRGLKEMHEAARLEPENGGVLIPRGAILLAVARHAPPEEGKRLLQTGVGDYEKVLKMQEPYFDKLSSHARGELLFGLADGYRQLGNQDKARSYFERLITDAKGSGRDKQAAAFLETGKLPPGAESCTGCHKN
jgi:tetratricopeptide (TPR) repeat protein